MEQRHWAEETAQRHLEALGWKHVASNYRIRTGEIDLVMREQDVIVFVEVRQRLSGRFGGAAGSLDARKRGRVRQTALHFMLTRYGHADRAMRIDAVLVDGSRARHRLTHLRDVA